MANITTPSPSATERAEQLVNELSQNAYVLLRAPYLSITALIAAEITAAEQAARPQWLPIETAPRNGTSILLYWPNGRIELSPIWKFWLHGAPTHWMPLPEPPSKETV